jgi:hypothetical protein
MASYSVAVITDDIVRAPILPFPKKHVNQAHFHKKIVD